MIAFSFPRFLRVLRREYTLARRPMLTGALIAFVIYFLLAVPQFYSDSNDLGDLGQGIFWPLAFYALFGSAFFYTGIKTKQQRLDFLMLPASNLEKFLGRWLFNMFWFFALMILGFLAADLLQYLICLVTGEGLKICYTLQAIRFYSGSFPIFDSSFPGLVATLWIHSIYLLGSQLFRKNHWLMTTLAIIALVIALALICSGVTYLLLYEIIDETYYVSFNVEFINNDQANWLLRLLLIALTIFNVWLSYRQFCRKQIINNRFFNIKKPQLNMKTRNAFFATAFAAVLLMASCTIYSSKDLGPRKTQKYDLKDFTSLDVSNVDYVAFVLDSVYSVEITAPEILMNKLTVSVSADSTLQICCENTEDFIRIAPGSISSSGEHLTEVVIHAPSLEAGAVGGSAYFEAKSPIVSPNFSVAVAGASEVKIPSVSCETFEGKIAGSGFFGVDSVRCSDFSAKIAGSGTMRAKLSQTTTTRLKIAGSGDMLVDFDNCRSAIASIAGSGGITLRGTLGSLEKEVAGSGEISTAKLHLDAYKPQPSNTQQP